MKKNEKKKNHKSRLLLLLLLLFLSAIVLTSATYAWFTSNKTVNVADLNVDVRAVNGLEISANAANWGFMIDKDDLINGYQESGGSKNQLPSVLTAVSSAGVVNADTHFMEMYNGVVSTECEDGYTASGSVCIKSYDATPTEDGEGNVTYSCPNGGEVSGTKCIITGTASYALSTSKAAEGSCYDYKLDGTANAGDLVNTCSSSYFMAFDIFLKVDKGTKLFLTANSGVFNAAATDSGIKNTTRVAFVVQGNVDSDSYYNGTTDESGAEITGVQAATALLNGTDAIIWEPNYDTHTNSGIIAAENFYNIVGLQNEGSSIQKYEGVKAEFTGIPLTEASSKVSGQENFFAEVPIDLATKADNKDLVDTGIYLSAGVTKVRVYYWVEGQDVDTENNASGSSMKLGLEFTIE